MRWKSKALAFYGFLILFCAVSASAQDFEIVKIDPVQKNFLTDGTIQFPEAPVGDDVNTVLLDKKSGNSWILVSRVVQRMQGVGENEKWIQIAWRPIIFMPPDSVQPVRLTSFRPLYTIPDKQ